MECLNIPLYNALCRVFGECHGTANPGNEGEFTTAQRKQSRVGPKTRLYANVLKWGETYRFNCPRCGDTRGRLCISHFSGRVFKGKSPSGLYHFNHVYDCKNSNCDLREYFADVKVDPKDTMLTQTPKQHTQYMEQPTAFPHESLPLISEDVPAYAIDYVRGRGFDPRHLFEQYNVRFVFKGTKYYRTEDPLIPKEEWKLLEFYDDRLLIPIIQGRRMISWQARSLYDAKKRKYLFPAGGHKSHYLYNVDNAAFSPNIVIVEGVTDVWKVGNVAREGQPTARARLPIQAVALFGKTSSTMQMDILCTMWSYDGSCVVMLDPGEEANMKDMCREFQRRKAFPNGVSYLSLKEGTDPGDYPTEELLKHIAKARINFQE